MPAHRSGGPSLTGALCQKNDIHYEAHGGLLFWDIRTELARRMAQSTRAQSWAISGPLSTVNGRHRRYLTSTLRRLKSRLYAPMSRPSKLAVLL